MCPDQSDPPGFSETGARTTEQQFWSEVKPELCSGSEKPDDDAQRRIQPRPGPSCLPASSLPERAQKLGPNQDQERSRPGRKPDEPDENQLEPGPAESQPGAADDEATERKRAEVRNDVPQPTGSHPPRPEPGEQDVKMRILSENMKFIEEFLIKISNYIVENYSPNQYPNKKNKYIVIAIT